MRFDGESLTYYNNDKVGNGGKYGLKRLALPNFCLPCVLLTHPPLSHWQSLLHSSVLRAAEPSS